MLNLRPVLISTHLLASRRPSRCLPRLQSTNSSSEASSPAPPTPPTQNHHDIRSFLDYASRTSLSPTSTTYVGTHYEYTVASALRALRLSLIRVGGRADSGIDLLGTWHLPSLPNPLRVIVQCKALKTKLGPNLIRELEGAFVGAPAGWRGEGILGVLVSPREATKGVREALGRSGSPIVWMMVEQEEERVRQVLWNRKASEVGLEGLGVTVRYCGRAGEEQKGKELVLTWKGEVLPGLDVKKEGDGERKDEG